MSHAPGMQRRYSHLSAVLRLAYFRELLQLLLNGMSQLDMFRDRHAQVKSVGDTPEAIEVRDLASLQGQHSTISSAGISCMQRGD